MWCSAVGYIMMLTLSLLAAPLTVTAQPRSTVPRIGILSPGGEAAPVWEALRQGLRDLGYVEGQNLLMVRRDAAGQLDRLPVLAAEVVRLPVDVSVTTGGVPATRAARQATTTIPIVMAEAGDPVGTGLVGKRLQCLKEVAPSVARVAGCLQLSADVPRVDRPPRGRAPRLARSVSARVR